MSQWPTCNERTQCAQARDLNGRGAAPDVTKIITISNNTSGVVHRALAAPFVCMSLLRQWAGASVRISHPLRLQQISTRDINAHALSNVYLPVVQMRNTLHMCMMTWPLCCHQQTLGLFKGAQIISCQGYLVLRGPWPVRRLMDSFYVSSFA